MAVPFKSSVNPFQISPSLMRSRGRLQPRQRTLPDVSRLTQGLENLLAVFKASECRDAAKLVKLAGSKQRHIAGHEAMQGCRVFGKQLRGGVYPLLLAIAEIEAGRDGINGVRHDGVARGQRPAPECIINKGRGGRRHAIEDSTP